MKKFRPMGLGLVLVLGLSVFYYLNQRESGDQIHSSTSAPIGDAKIVDEAPVIVESTRANLKPVPISSARVWTRETQKKLAVLNQILNSKNDNDPRLDRELAQLSDETQEALREKYRSLDLENRNGRGTIVFLLSRFMKADQNQMFFLEVMQEPACLSLENCNRTPPTDNPEALHSAQAGGLEVTLAYPQMVVLQSIENALEDTAVPHPQWMPILQSAVEYSIPVVQRKAERILERLKVAH